MTEASGPSLVVRGTHGFLAGEERILRVGDALVVGRSRDADLSVRKSKRFTARPDGAEILLSKRWLSVSRKHVRIHYLHADLIEIRDLSSNGTLLDGHKVDCVALTDLKERSHVVGLGSSERLLLEMPGYRELGIETEVAPDG